MLVLLTWLALSVLATVLTFADARHWRLPVGHVRTISVGALHRRGSSGHELGLNGHSVDDSFAIQICIWIDGGMTELDDWRSHSPTIQSECQFAIHSLTYSLALNSLAFASHSHPIPISTNASVHRIYFVSVVNNFCDVLRLKKLLLD